MPKLEHHIFICGNCRPPDHPRGCCDPGGNEELRALFKTEVRRSGLRAKVRANRAGCLDHCEHGPCAVVYPGAVWYGGLTSADVARIVSEHLGQGRPVESLMIPDECINNPKCPHRRGHLVAEYKQTRGSL